MTSGRDKPPSGFERDKPGTSARTEAEADIETLRRRGGPFVEAVARTRMPMAVSDARLPGNPIVFANDAFLRLSGYSMLEVLGQQPHFLNGPDTDPDDAARFREALRRGEDIVVDTWQYRKDGSPFFAAVFVSPIAGEDGAVIQHFLSYLDITRRVEAEQQVRAHAAELEQRVEERTRTLSESEVRYRKLFESMDEAYAVVEVLKDEAGRWTDFRFIDVNPAFVEHTSMPWPVGKTATELLGTPNPRWAQLYGQALDNGKPIRIEETEPTLGLTFDLNIFALQHDQNRVAVLFTNITERKRAEVALQESEERHAFLLKLSDALRPLVDAAEIQATTTRLVASHLGVDRSMYADVEGERGAETGLIRGQYVRPPREGEVATAPFPHHFTYDHYGEHRMAARYAGDLLLVDDIEADPDADATERANWALVGIRAAVVAPLVKEGRLVAEFGVHSAAPRVWTEPELSIIREAAERTWEAAERARAEAALRESEEQLRLIVENARDYAIFTLDRDGLVTDWREGAEAVFDYSRDEMLGRDSDILFTPEDNAAGEPEKERAVAAETGKAPNVRWHVRKDGQRVFIEGVCTALHDAEGRLAGFLKVGRDATERHAAQERQDMLLAELQHRVRNSLGVVRSIARRTAEVSDSLESMADHLDGRIAAFARVQAAVTRDPTGRVDLRSMIQDELLAYATLESDSVTLEGPDTGFHPRPAETISLAIHELATNAVKHGALAEVGGRLRISWRLTGAGESREFSLVWQEMAAAGVEIRHSSHEGFGTELLLRAVPYELQAETSIDYQPWGATFQMSMPFPDSPD